MSPLSMHVSAIVVACLAHSNGFDISERTASGNIWNGCRIGPLTGRGRLYSCHAYDDNYTLGNPGSNFYGPVEQASNALQGDNPFINTLW